MKIISWNINGIRSLKKDIRVIVEELEADIACFQETKITKELMTEKLALVDGFRSYFSYSRARAGYSGVVTYCRRSMQPLHASDSLITGLPNEGDITLSLPTNVLKSLDSEGRTLITQHKLSEKKHGKSLLTVINLYCPCVTGETEGRELFRLQFLQTLEERVRQLQKISLVVVVGDINISHRIIDSCDPGDTEEFLSQPHRQWLDQMLSGEDGLLFDSYRTLHPEQKFAYTCWNTKIGGRQTNFGTRIDYILLDKHLKANLSTSEVLAKYMGSDHCPVRVALTDISILPSTSPPLLCSSNRFKAKQQKLTMFMSKGVKKSHEHMFDTMDPAELQAKPDKKKRKNVNNPTLNSFVKIDKSVPGNKPTESPTDSGSASQSQSSPSESSQSQSSTSEKSESQTNTTVQSGAWNKLFAKKPTPSCSGHKEACVLQTVKKVGKNKGRQFYSCARPVGLPSDYQSRCSFFMWKEDMK